MKFIVCGDMLFSSRNLAQRIDSRIVDLLKQADAVFANAEFCTPERETSPAPGRGYITSVSPDTLQEFVDLNVKLVNFANNHTGDFGVQGVLDTLKAAESRNLIPIGIGRSLSEARKAQFLDTKTGRIAVVAAGITRSEIFAASDPGEGISARPGVSPLRWNRSYVLPEKEFEQLRSIDRLLGTAKSRDIGQRIETFPPDGRDQFRFGSLYEGNLMIEKGDHAYVKTNANTKDEDALLRRIQDASRRSDFVLCTVHTHEGVNENWYSDEPAHFVEEFAHAAIDAGANAFVGHGAHFLRGIEIYQGKPIFYNIGSLLMEFEAGESKICPEMYESYGYDPHIALPSDLHSNRIKNKNGDFIGFGSEARFSQNIAVVFDIKENGSISFYGIPLQLGLTREQPLKRGLPVIADESESKVIADRLTAISKKYGTKISYNSKEGVLIVSNNR